uniref:Ninjurin 2 n=1 Tax=Oreochromis aureus TaxID=47969 RepID=A0AAZ1XCC9_OREAU
MIYLYGEARPRNALRLIDMNHYATKKSAAQSMLDVALLMANSSQLKTVLYVGPQYRFYVPLIVLLSLSIALQVIVGLLLVFIAVKCDLNDVRKHAKLNRMNNVATVFVFFTVLINIFITALGFQGHTIRFPYLQNTDSLFHGVSCFCKLDVFSSQLTSLTCSISTRASPLPIDLNRTGGI